jgi:hypothetical protein
MKRIGGPPNFVKNAPRPDYRIDGGWFVCFDGQLNPVRGICNVLSFGINHDYTFDEIMEKDYGCHVYSFDPFVETKLFKSIRDKNPALNGSSHIPVNSRWSFYRLHLCFLFVCKQKS